MPPHFVWGVNALWCAEMLEGAFKSYMRTLPPSATHWFFKKVEVPYSEGTDGFLSSRSRFRCPSFEPLLRFARFGVHVGARAPLAEAGLVRADISPPPVPNLQFRSMFERPTLPEYRFWKGSHLKTSNEIASEGVTEAFSFDVLERSPYQNSGFGAVGISKLRTKLLVWWSEKRFRSKF